MALPILAAAARVVTSLFGRVAARAGLQAGLREMGTIIKQNAARGGKDMLKVKTRIDTSGFDAAFKRYIEFNKRAIPEILNTKAYFVCRNAVQMTTAADPSKIEQQLKDPSRDFPGVPLGAILVNAQRGKKGEKGLRGSRMQSEINRIIRARKRTVNFLRSGWIPAIQSLDRFVPKKGGAPSYKKVKTFGAPKGGAKGAKPTSNWKPMAEIWNAVTGGTNKHGLESKSDPSRVQKIIEDGLQKAINKEEASMREYVEKKLNEGINKFNRGG